MPPRSLPFTVDPWGASYRELDLARIHAMVDEPDSAIARLEHLLAIPGDVTPALLRLDPAWAPLRGDPRFQRLVGTSP